MMPRRVLIPTAGLGSRLGDITKNLNKSLVSVANKPIVSHIIDLFSADYEFVIALGYKGELVRQFLEITYPDRCFHFVEVKPYEGEGAGLGLSILCCKDFLQQPFIFISCDTLIKGEIPVISSNWVGYSDSEEIHNYRTVSVKDLGRNLIAEKGAHSNDSKAYIGLAGIHDYNLFWSAMENGGKVAIETGEVFGINHLPKDSVEKISFNWFDTGNLNLLQKARNEFSSADEPNILEKQNEAIWFVNETVVKFSFDNKFISNRVKRSSELSGFIPEIRSASSNMYSYIKAEGTVFSKIANAPLFEKLLDHSTHFWDKKELSGEDATRFRDICLKFYRDKTYERVDLFFQTFHIRDGVEKINGISVPPVKDLLEEVDWSDLANGLPGRFHGDFHFENILFDIKKQKWTFLDWRQDFGGDLCVGDIYYDFAKLFHGLIITHELIVRNHFNISWEKDHINYDFHRKQSLVECEAILCNWVSQNGYDLRKVKILTALIFLNIAALHHNPYSLLLFALGKDMLNKFTRN
jgi:hypothetical protein